jgi:hypothetical protein
MNSLSSPTHEVQMTPGLTPMLFPIPNGHNRPWLLPKRFRPFVFQTRDPPFFDTSTSLFFLIFVSSERLKRFALFLLNLMLGRILPRTPYAHSSTLELKWFSVSACLTESLCIRALSLLIFNRIPPPRDSEQLGVSTCVRETVPKIDKLTVRGSSLSHHRAQAFTNTKHVQFI